MRHSPPRSRSTRRRLPSESGKSDTGEALLSPRKEQAEGCVEQPGGTINRSSTPAPPALVESFEPEIAALQRTPLSANTIWQEEDGSALKTARAPMCPSCGASPCSQMSPTSLKTFNQADVHLSELVRRIQASPESHIFWKELRAYLVAQREEERRHGVHLQTELPIVTFSEDSDFVSTQIEVRALIAREPLRRARSSTRSTPMTSTSQTPRTGRPGTARVPGTARPHSSSIPGDPRNSPLPSEDDGVKPPEQTASNISPEFSDDEDEEVAAQYEVLAKKLLQGKLRRRGEGSPGRPLTQSGSRAFAEALAQLRVVSDAHGQEEDSTEDDDLDHAKETCADDNECGAAVEAPTASSSQVVQQRLCDDEIITPRRPPPSALCNDAQYLPSIDDEPSMGSGGSPSSSAPTSPSHASYLYKQLVALKQRTSFIKIAVDPGNRVFLRELQCFEDQLRQAATRELSTAVAAPLVAPSPLKRQTPARPVISASRAFSSGVSVPLPAPAAAARSVTEEEADLHPHRQVVIPKIAMGTVRRRSAGFDLNPEPTLSRFERSASTSEVTPDDRSGTQGQGASSAAPSNRFVRSHTDVASFRQRRSSQTTIAGAHARTSAASHTRRISPSRFQRTGSTPAVN